MSAVTVDNTVTSQPFRAYFVRGVYQKLVGRAPTATEAAPLITQLGGGAKGWQNVVVAVAGSPLYFQKTGGTNALFVGRLFQDLVGRAPDATEETPAALDFLKDGTRDGLAAVVADTPECRAHWVQFLYGALLNRPATDLEATSGSATLEGGGMDELAASLLSSPEFWKASGKSQSGWTQRVNQLLTDAPASDDGMGGMTGDPTLPTSLPASYPANNSRAPMVQALLSSPEYSANVLRTLYQKYLHRAPTPAELQSAGAGASVDQITMSLLTSDEYFNRAGGTTTAYLNRLSKDLLGKAGGSTSITDGLPSTGDLLDLWHKLPHRKK